MLASNGHGSIERAVRFLGIGGDQVTDLPLDETERVLPETLDAGLREAGEVPVIVILKVGDLDTGSFDRFDELIPIARRSGA